MGSKLEPVLELVDPKGRVVATSANNLIAHVLAEAGTYAIGLAIASIAASSATSTLKVGGAGRHQRLPDGPAARR